MSMIDQEQPVPESTNTATDNDEIDISDFNNTDAPEVEKPADEKDVKKEESKVRLHEIQKQILFGTIDINDISVESIDLPQGNRVDTNQFVADLPPTVQVVTDKMSDWGASVQESQQAHPSFGLYHDFFNNEKAHLTNHPAHNGVALAAGRDRGKIRQDSELQGPQALAAVVETLGHGTILQHLLWNSGIGLKFRGWNDIEIAAFTSLMDANKSKLGRATYGLSFGSTGVINEYQAVDFALDHVISTTADFGVDKVLLRKHISCLDINGLILGVLSASYPNGFSFSIPCTAGMDKCTHVNRGLVSVSKMMITDDSKLTVNQLEHLTRRADGKTSLDAIKAYQNALVNQGHVVTFKRKGKDIVSFELVAPSLEVYFNSAFEWMDRITKLVENISNKNTTPKEKEEMYEKFSAAITMRQYRHWIKSITILETNNNINDAKSVDTVCEQLSTDVEMVNFIVEEVVKLVSRASVSAVGIDVYACEKCGHKHSDKEKEIIPIDIMYSFFVLMQSRMSRILAKRS